MLHTSYLCLHVCAIEGAVASGRIVGCYSIVERESFV